MLLSGETTLSYLQTRTMPDGNAASIASAPPGGLALPRWSSWTAVVLAALLCCGAVACWAWSLAIRFPQSSDTVQSFLAAQSIIHGNVLLSGWHLTSDNFFFTDTLPTAAAVWLLGVRPLLLEAIPALAYALIVAACVAACLRPGRRLRDNLAALALIVLLLGFPPTGIMLPMLVSDTHGASILFSLLALMLLAMTARAGRLRDRKPAAAGFAVLAAAAVASDPFVVVFAFGPALVVLGARLLLCEAPLRTLALLGLVVAACGAGGLFPALVAHLGGFVTDANVSSGFVAPDHIGANLIGLIFGLLYGSGADILGKEVASAGTIASAARLLGWGLGAIGVWRRLPLILRRNGSLFDQLLLAGIVFTAAGCVLSNMFYLGVQMNIFEGGAGVRYLSPILVFGAILGARAVPGVIAGLPTRRARTALVGLLACLAGGLMTWHSLPMARQARASAWVTNSEFTRLGEWLGARGLTCGVGDYWVASITTALTDGEVRVRAMRAPSEDRLVPFLWIADARWYARLGRPQFVLWRGDQPDLYNVNARTAAATYGPVLRVEKVWPFDVAILAPPSSGPVSPGCGS